MAKRIKVTILGCSGMLGSMILKALSRADEFDLVGTCRHAKEIRSFATNYPKVKFRQLDAKATDIAKIAKAINDTDWVINAIGIIKPYIHDDNVAEVETALLVNSLFSHRLAKAAGAKTRIIQIATDCVFSGQKGKYVESDPHDALDVYGKSKSLGEAYFPNMYHLRCSIIGPELTSHLSLLDWFLHQPRGAEVSGYTNHHWNGVTTLHFARLCRGIIKANLKLPHVQHLVPSGLISKADILKAFAKAFDRQDIKIKPAPANVVIDRTLTTNDVKLNQAIWQAAGYPKPPTIEQMIKELAEFEDTK